MINEIGKEGAVAPIVEVNPPAKEKRSMLRRLLGRKTAEAAGLEAPNQELHTSEKTLEEMLGQELVNAVDAWTASDLAMQQDLDSEEIRTLVDDFLLSVVPTNRRRRTRVVDLSHSYTDTFHQDLVLSTHCISRRLGISATGSYNANVHDVHNNLGVQAAVQNTRTHTEELKIIKGQLFDICRLVNADTQQTKLPADVKGSTTNKLLTHNVRTIGGHKKMYKRLDKANYNLVTKIQRLIHTDEGQFAQQLLDLVADTDTDALAYEEYMLRNFLLSDHLDHETSIISLSLDRAEEALRSGYLIDDFIDMLEEESEGNTAHAFYIRTVGRDVLKQSIVDSLSDDTAEKLPPELQQKLDQHIKTTLSKYRTITTNVKSYLPTGHTGINDLDDTRLRINRCFKHVYGVDNEVIMSYFNGRTKTTKRTKSRKAPRVDDTRTVGFGSIAEKSSQPTARAISYLTPLGDGTYEKISLANPLALQQHIEGRLPKSMSNKKQQTAAEVCEIITALAEAPRIGQGHGMKKLVDCHISIETPGGNKIRYSAMRVSPKHFKGRNFSKEVNNCRVVFCLDKGVISLIDVFTDHDSYDRFTKNGR